MLFISNSGCSLVRLKCASGGREIGGSNPLTPTINIASLYSSGAIFLVKQNLNSLKRFGFEKIELIISKKI